MEQITGESIIPFGAHFGTKFKDLPGDYLLHLYYKHKNLRPDIREYIEGRLDELETKFIKTLPYVKPQQPSPDTPSGRDSIEATD